GDRRHRRHQPDAGPPAARRGGSMKSRTHQLSAGRGTYVLLGAVVLVSLFPLYWSVVAASNDQAGISKSPPDLVPGTHLLDNLRRMLDLVDMRKALVNSFVVSATVTVFGVFFMRQYLVTALPTELIEAARVDGCSTLRTYWNVVLPVARPAAAVLGMLTFMNTWNDFYWPLLVLTPQNPTVQVALS